MTQNKSRAVVEEHVKQKEAPRERVPMSTSKEDEKDVLLFMEILVKQGQ